MTNLFFTYRFLYLYVINQVICVKGFFYSSSDHNSDRLSGPGSPDGSRISGRSRISGSIIWNVPSEEFGMSKTQNWVFVMSIETHESGSSAKISFLKTIKICRIDQKSRNRLPDPNLPWFVRNKTNNGFPNCPLMAQHCALKIASQWVSRK